MALTGRADGPPMVAPGNPGSFVCDGLRQLGLSLPGLLGERAAHQHLRRQGPTSCGGSFRMFPARDGWIGLSLARPTDLELLPALVERPVGADPWGAISAWARSGSCAEAEERMILLGLPGTAIAEVPPSDRAPVVITEGPARPAVEHPLVVNLSSLWAGPLCARLLRLRGARVVKVEDSGRPDGARLGSISFFEELNGGQELLTVDLARERDRLVDLLLEADLVIEGSRPRALRQLGVVAEEVVASGTSWLSITARGRDSEAIGFGDDVAAGAGMVLRDGDDLLPVGDALADPLTGVAAAAAGAEALLGARAQLVDVSMRHVVAATVGPVPEHEVVSRAGRWVVEDATGEWQVAEPQRA